MRFSLCTGVFFLLAAINLPAQRVLHVSSDTSRQQNTSIRISVVNPHGKTPVAYSGHAMYSDSVQQAIKLSPLNFVRGDFSMYYEYRLARQFSVEGAAGVTYVDYMYEAIQNGARFISAASESNKAKFYSGFSSRLQFRWYPSRYETAITGYYLAPEISYRNYKMDYFVNTGLIDEPHRVNRKYTDLKLQFGHQDADPYENMFWEWYIAAGIRHFNEDFVNHAGTDAQFTNSNYWGFVVGGGIKIGFTL